MKKFGIRIVVQEYTKDDKCVDTYDLFAVVRGLPRDALDQAESWIAWIRDMYDEVV